MTKFLFTGSYTAEGAKGVLKEGGTGRRAATEKLVASLGGTVEAYYFAFGSDDFFLIADLPGNAAAAAGALTAAATGAISTRTIVLLTPEEIDAAAKLSPEYRAPGG
ncbi:MAG TPA: GYD domain-containing protein [Candidatus Limnocylindrales bacterium]|nr:GYD domain-containing protein [Candidatus Limnocylindrales bacterium]